MNKFRTKRKSSSSLFTAWTGILVVALVLAVAFLGMEMQIGHGRSIRFMNIRTTNIDSLAEDSTSNKMVTDQTPFLVITKNDVVFGSVKSLVTPNEKSPIIIVPRADWQKSLRSQLGNKTLSKELFPAKVIAVALEGNESSDSFVDLLNSVVEMIHAQNKFHGSPNMIPEAILVGFPRKRG